MAAKLTQLMPMALLGMLLLASATSARGFGFMHPDMELHPEHGRNLRKTKAFRDSNGNFLLFNWGPFHGNDGFHVGGGAFASAGGSGGVFTRAGGIGGFASAGGSVGSFASAGGFGGWGGDGVFISAVKKPRHAKGRKAAHPKGQFTFVSSSSSSYSRGGRTQGEVSTSVYDPKTGKMVEYKYSFGKPKPT